MISYVFLLFYHWFLSNLPLTVFSTQIPGYQGFAILIL